MDVEKQEMVTMRTTRPIFTSSDSRLTAENDKVLLRPARPSDLEPFHAMRSNQDAMINSLKGFIDKDQSETQEWMDRFLPPNDLKTFTWVIEDVRNPGELVGSIGVHTPQPPEVGYMIRREHWQKGYASAAMKAFLPLYWALERKELEVEDDLPELNRMPDEKGFLREHITAIIEKDNTGSRRVLEKNGFNLVEGKKVDVCDHRGPAVLLWYYIERP